MMMKDNKQLQTLTKYWRAIAGVVGLVVIIAWSGGACSSKMKPGKESYEPGQAYDGQSALFTAAVTRAAARVFVVGTMASEERINLSARIPAYVNEVLVSAGDKVKKGQLLASLDDREIQEQLAATEAQLKQAEAEFQRTKQLFDSKAATDQSLTAAESAYSAAKAQAERVKVMLSYAQVTAPIDGVITERKVEAGDLASPGQVLMSVYDPFRMRLEAPVPIRLVEHLAMGQEVEVLLERPSRFFKGKVTEIVSEVDPSSRTQKVKIHLDEVRDEVLPGTFGRFWVPDDEREAIMAPSSAIYHLGQLQMVQVLVNGRVIRRLVTTGNSVDNQIDVLSGLGAGDVILVNPAKGG
ncbi:MAG: efflux RND transporter periplasmic adaptor subunit [Lentisphaerota bacterium]